MQEGQGGGQAAIDFFWKRIEGGGRSQSGLDMHHRDAAIERRQRGHEGGSRVALHDGHVGLAFGEQGIHRQHHAAGQSGQRLRRLHQRQVDLRFDVEHGQHLVEQLAVLRGEGDCHVETRPPPKFGNHRCQLDGLRPRPETKQHFQLGFTARRARNISLTTGSISTAALC